MKYFNLSDILYLYVAGFWKTLQVLHVVNMSNIVHKWSEFIIDKKHLVNMSDVVKILFMFLKFHIVMCVINNSATLLKCNTFL